LELCERAVARHEPPRLHAARRADPLLDPADVATGRVGGEEHADLRLGGDMSGERLRADQHAIARKRQSERDADDEHVERGRRRRLRQARDRLREARPVVAQPGDHPSLPWSSRRARFPELSIRPRSWVAISTVTPTWLNSPNMAMISSAYSASMLAVGS